MPLDQLGRHTDEVVLGVDGVDDRATAHPGRRAGAVGQPSGEQTRRARLGRRDGEPLVREQPGDDVVDGRAVAGGHGVAELRGQRRHEAVVGARAAERRTRVTTSSSPSRRQVLISRPSRPGSSRRRVAAIAGLGSPPQPHGRLAQLGPPHGQRVPHQRRLERRGPHLLELAGRSRSTTAGGWPSPSPAGTTRPGAVPVGSRTSRPAGDQRLLPGAPAAIASGSTVQPRRALNRATIAATRVSRAGSRLDGRPCQSPTTTAVRSSAVGPRPPEVTTRSTRDRARKSSASIRSWGRSPTTTVKPTSTPDSAAARRARARCGPTPAR